MEAAEQIIPVLLGLAVLLPLASFWVILAFGPRMGKAGEFAAFLATGAIVAGFGLSAIAAVLWFTTMPEQSGPQVLSRPDAREDVATHIGPSGTAGLLAGAAGPAGEHGDEHHQAHPSRVLTGNWYTLAEMGSLELTIGYYVDSLTIVMFCMVTLIASCIHFYSMGYMHDEERDVTDHEVTLSDGSHLHRPGRYHRFFQYLSLFCFSMLGLVVAGNLAMTFVFWELVGICSYFLIGFYVERPSASTAANKAFIVNRVGDFGFIIGLMAIWSTLGTFNYGDIEAKRPGIFSQVRPEHPAEHHPVALAAADDHGHPHAYELIVPAGMLMWGGSEEVRQTEMAARRSAALDPSAAPEEIDARVEHEVAQLVQAWQENPDAPAHRWGYWLLIVAGIGIFAGCVGKSAQFPLHTWLPDAMEGPTPVSALVHSATMVAAGVFLAARFYPFFLPEVLLVIAVTGCITLFLAATIALVATDIKRVLAYSTISQLGYMMLAIGLGGWLAGVLHLITHAFFKSLLFMCSGSVIHAVHTNEMPEMGGLIKKMPITGWTMFIGCLAIAGMGVPFVIGLSGYYSKDAILEQAYYYGMLNPGWQWIFFATAAGGATLTAFYMFRLWFMTFTGRPRNQHRYDHAHESPAVMTYPLILLAAFAVAVAWPIFGLSEGIDTARHAGAAEETVGALVAVTIPNEHVLHDPRGPVHPVVVPRVTMIAFFTALAGIGLAAAFYWRGYANPAEVREQFGSIYGFLWNKWWFDELYEFIFVRPTLFFSRMCAAFDRRWIDWFVDGTAACTVWFTRAFEFIVDRGFVDGLVNILARWTYSLGNSLRGLQTGHVRQYAMFIVIATVTIFVLLTFFWNITWAQ